MSTSINQIKTYEQGLSILQEANPKTIADCLNALKKYKSSEDQATGLVLLGRIIEHNKDNETAKKIARAIIKSPTFEQATRTVRSQIRSALNLQDQEGVKNEFFLIIKNTWKYGFDENHIKLFNKAWDQLQDNFEEMKIIDKEVASTKKTIFLKDTEVKNLRGGAAFFDHFVEEMNKVIMKEIHVEKLLDFARKFTPSQETSGSSTTTQPDTLATAAQEFDTKAKKAKDKAKLAKQEKEKAETKAKEAEQLAPQQTAEKQPLQEETEQAKRAAEEAKQEKDKAQLEFAKQLVQKAYRSLSTSEDQIQEETPPTYVLDALLQILGNRDIDPKQKTSAIKKFVEHCNKFQSLTKDYFIAMIDQQYKIMTKAKPNKTLMAQLKKEVADKIKQ